MKKICLLLALVLAVTMVIPTTSAKAMTMKDYAKKYANKSGTKYIIVTKWFASGQKGGRTKVYRIYNKNKKNVSVKEIKYSRSTGPKLPRFKIAKQFHGLVKLTEKKIYDRKGHKYDSKGRPLYHMYGFSAYDKNNYGIHSVLYKRGSNKFLYHNTKDKIQNRNAAYDNNWSDGCTRVSSKLATWIYHNCKKGTAYYMYP